MFSKLKVVAFSEKCRNIAKNYFKKILNFPKKGVDFVPTSMVYL
jgi:hypothetical protein